MALLICLCISINVCAKYKYHHDWDYTSYYAFESNGLWGYKYMDCIYIYPQYEKVSLTADHGYFAVKINGKWGFANQNNKLLCPAIYDDVNLSADNNSVIFDVVCEKIKEADSNAKLINYIFSSKDPNETRRDIVFDGQYCNMGENYICFDRSLRKNGECKRPFFVAAVKYGDKWGYIDALGNFIIKPQYEEACAFTFCWSKKWEGVIANVKKDGKWGVIDLDNNIIRPFKGKTPISDEKYKNKLRAIKPSSEIIKKSRSGLYKTIKEHLADKLEEANLDTMVIKEYNLKTVEKDGMYGLNDNKGNICIPPVYDKIYSPQYNIVHIVKNNRHGLFDLEKNMEIVPCIYDNISTFDDKGWATIEIGEEKGNVNVHGYCDLEMELYKKNNKENEYTNYMRIAQINPYNIIVLCKLGQISFNENHYDESIDFYGKAKEIIGDSYAFSDIQFRNRAIEGYARAWNFKDGYYVKRDATNSQSGWSYLAGFLNSSLAVYNTITNNKSSQNNSVGTDYQVIQNNTSEAAPKTKTSSADSDRDAKWMTANYQTQKAVYSNYESQLINMSTYPSKYNESQKKDIQAKMKKIRETIVSHGGTCQKSKWETW